MAENLKNKTLAGLFWSFLERVGSHLISFVVSIILARKLMPDDYGLIAIVLVFVNLCDVFVNGGFGAALIQKKCVKEQELSSIFWLSLMVSVFLYIVLFFSAPYIASFYKMPVLVPVLRLLGLRLPLTAFNTVQRAIVSRSMQFRTYFYGSFFGTIISAFVGVIMVYNDWGVWSLVGQQITSAISVTVIIAICVRWYPRFIFSFNSVKSLFSYGWKMLAGSLIDSIYNDFRSLYIGKLYKPSDLAFYDRGKQFPSLLVINVNSSIAAVLFPALSKKQDDLFAVKNIMRRAIKTSSFIIMPLMIGLIAVAHPLVVLLLTEKWLPCVVFIQIVCLEMALMPIQTSNLQAIYALGRSDIGLKLNIIKKSVGFIIILLTATYSVKAMAWGGVASAIFASFVNSYPNKKLLNYGYWAQMQDIFPCFLLSILMGAIVYLLNFIPLNNLIVLLIIQAITGLIIYLTLSFVFRVESLKFILDTLPIRKIVK